MAKKASKENYNFIENRPLGKDLFEGKSQERTAGVICDIIKENQFQVIGIDGGWGVGKSNLVQIVDNKLKDHSFFIYDVWGHQEDEQRRSLLVELTAFICNEEQKLVANEAAWNKKLKKLLSKQKEVTVENLPHLSLGFILAVISIVWTPTAVALVDKINFPGLLWKILFLVLPWIFVITLLVVKFIQSDKKFRAFKPKVIQAFQETFQVYTNKQTKETKIETVSEYEPPVKAFQDWMSEIDRDLKGKKLVIVLDNFDRLPKQHILSVWSSVHVFFAEKKYKSIKVIIPFDRKHIKSAFSDMNGKNDDESFANDYINKTFDIVFRVAPPILSSWKVFFRDNWKVAFPGFSEDEYVRVEQAYETLRPKITPREIVDFINNCVTLKLLDDSVPDRYIAVYLLRQEKILDKPLIAILDLSYLEGLEPIYSDDEEYPKFITALAYQIDPKNALEVVYRKQLKDCLVNNDADDFEEISKLKVFKSIINPVIHEISDFRNPILVLDNLGDVETITKSQKEAVWQTIYAKVKKVEKQEGELDEYQLVLLKNIKEARRHEWLKILVDLLWSDDKDFDIEIYLDNLDTVIIYCKDNNLNVDPLEKLKVRNTSVENFKMVIDVKGADYSKYKIKCSYKKMDDFLKELDGNSINQASFIKYIENPIKLTGFRDQLSQILKNNRNNKDLVEEVIQYLKLTTGKRIKLFEYFGDADIHRLVNQIDIDDSLAPDLAAMRLALFKNVNNNHNNAYQKFLNSDSEEFHEKVANVVEWYVDFDDLLVESASFSSRLMKGVVKKLLEIDPSIRVLNLMPILRHLRSITQVNEIQADSVLLSIENYGVDEIGSEELISLDIPTLELLSESATTTASVIVDKLTEHFKNLSKEEWSEVFSDLNSNTFQKLKALDFKDWNAFALEEYGKLLVRVAESGSIDNEDIQEWLINSFNQSGKNLESVYTSFRDKLINNSITTDIFRIYISQLFQYGGLEERADDVMRVIFDTELLDDKWCVEEMYDNSKGLKSLLKACSSSYKTNFREALQARISKQNIDSLSSALGFRIKEKPEAEK